MEEWRRKFLNWPKDGDIRARGQCLSCGLLGKRSLDPSEPTVEEVPADHRHGSESLLTLSNGGKAVPWCLVRAADLPLEMRQRSELMKAGIGDAKKVRPEPDSHAWNSMAALQAVWSKRDCPEWMPYREFLSPTEHRQERDLLRLEEDRRKHQTRLAEMELSVHRGSQEIAAALRAATEQTGRFTTKWTYAAFIIAALSLVLVLASYLFPDAGTELVDWVADALNRAAQQFPEASTHDR